MTDRLRDAARRRQTNIDAAREAAERIDKERAERLAAQRATPTVSGTPPPEAPTEPDEETTP